MLLPDNIHPENSIYFCGAVVLNELQTIKTCSLLDLYKLLNEVKKMSFSVFILSLDWLYLIDVLMIKEERIVLCS